MMTLRVSKRIGVCIGVLLVSGMLCAHAANSGTIIRDFAIGVSPQQDHAFRTGIKQWLKCIRAHGATHPMYAYDAETGNLNEYTFLEPHATWAELDAEPTAAGKACEGTFRQSVVPHFSGAYSAFLKMNSKITHNSNSESLMAKLSRVISYHIKWTQYHAFMAVAKAITAAADKAHWNGHYVGYSVLAGGEHSPQLLIVEPHDSWADLGKKMKPSMRKMLQSVYGKTATKALLYKLQSATTDASSKIWSYDKELSFVPSNGK